MALGQLTLALGALGGFPSFLLSLLRFAGVEVRFLAMTAGLFTQAFTFLLALSATLARGQRGEHQEDEDYDDYGDDQSGGHSFFFTRLSIGKPPLSG